MLRRAATGKGLRELEAPTGVEPVMEVLQTSALPLGYGAVSKSEDPADGAQRRVSFADEEPSPCGEGEISGAGDGI